MRGIYRVLLGVLLVVIVGYISAFLARTKCEDKVADAIVARLNGTTRTVTVYPERSPDVVEILNRNGVGTTRCNADEPMSCYPTASVNRATVRAPFIVAVHSGFSGGFSAGDSATRRFLCVFGIIVELQTTDLIIE